jgi:hypothetical protein
VTLEGARTRFPILFWRHDLSPFNMLYRERAQIADFRKGE